VLVLAPVILLVAAGAIANGVASGHDPHTVLFGLLAAAVTSAQISYFVAAIAAHICAHGLLVGHQLGFTPCK